ncbi:MAG: COQ9 family protein [Acetobacteraceae bacterium]|nr:MAG: COQ9 family protein [Acetobacteraceae bacterium]
MNDDSAIRDAAIRAMLPLAGAEGWNGTVIRSGLAAAGEDPALAESWFPTGAPGAVAAWIDLANREMIDAAAAEGVAGLRVPARIRRVVELRLTAVAPHKVALRRALSLLAIPYNLPVALRTTAATVDAMWHAAGDTSADFSWYTRRATLAGVYGTTLAFWMRNDDPALGEAMEFLDRRLAGVARLGRRRHAA